MSEEHKKFEEILKSRDKIIGDQALTINELKYRLDKVGLILAQKPLIDPFLDLYDKLSHTHDGRWQDRNHPIIY